MFVKSSFQKRYFLIQKNSYIEITFDEQSFIKFRFYTIEEELESYNSYFGSKSQFLDPDSAFDNQNPHFIKECAGVASGVK